MELTKFEQGLKQIVATMHNGNPSHIKKVIKEIRAIMPPTCGVEQRKFLDEIEKCYRGDLATESIALGKYSCIIDKDIVADLHKVTKGE